MGASSPRILEEEIEEFMRVSKSERDDSVRCRQIMGQLLRDLEVKGKDIKREDELRETALKLACNLHGYMDVINKDMTKTAEKFYKFLIKTKSEIREESKTITETTKDIPGAMKIENNAQISYVYNIGDITEEELKKKIIETVCEDLYENGTIRKMIKGI